MSSFSAGKEENKERSEEFKQCCHRKSKILNNNLISLQLDITVV